MQRKRKTSRQSLSLPVNFASKKWRQLLRIVRCCFGFPPLTTGTGRHRVRRLDAQQQEWRLWLRLPRYLRDIAAVRLNANRLSGDLRHEAHVNPAALLIEVRHKMQAGLILNKDAVFTWGRKVRQLWVPLRPGFSLNFQFNDATSHIYNTPLHWGMVPWYPTRSDWVADQNVNGLWLTPAQLKQKQ